MLIRPSTSSDLDAISRLEREVFRDEVYPRFFFRQAYDLWRELFLVAQAVDGDLAGYILGAPALGTEEGWILSVAVGAGHRGRGAGRRLTEQLLHEFESRGARRVCITVHPENEAALRLYRRLGFEPASRDEEYFGAGEPRLIMVHHFPSAT